MDRVGSTVIQKLKGQFKKARGRLKKATGDDLGGTMDEIEGRAEEEMADARARFGRRSR